MIRADGPTRENTNMNQKLLVGALAALTLTSMGCSYLQASGERSRVIRMEMERYVYDEPCTRVFPEVRTVLFQEGYTVRNTGEGSMTLETEWTRFENGRERRYLAQGIASDPQSCQLRVSYEELSSTDSRSTGRDYDMELRVLQVVDPKDHAEIQRRAEAAYQASLNS